MSEDFSIELNQEPELQVEVEQAPALQILIEEEDGTVMAVEGPTTTESLLISVPGPQGERGPMGELVQGTGDLFYRHEQGMPSTEWNIQHNLGKRPSIRVVDSSNRDVVGDYEDVDDNHVVLYFSAPFSGVAYLN